MVFSFLVISWRLILNTRPVQNDEPVELLPDFVALLRWFRAASVLSPRNPANLQKRWGKSPRAQRTVEAARRLRVRLRKEIVAWEHGGAVHRATMDELNRLMAKHPMRARLKANGKTPSTELYFEPQQQPEDLFAPLAHSAASQRRGMEVVSRSAWADAGVRPCQNVVVGPHFKVRARDR